MIEEVLYNKIEQVNGRYWVDYVIRKQNGQTINGEKAFNTLEEAKAFRKTLHA